MGLMRHVHKRNGIWWVRINIPADLQAEWGKTAEWRSLKTTDELAAIQAAPAIIAEIKGRIAALRRGAETAAVVQLIPEPATEKPIRLTPEQAMSLIERWRNDCLEAAYVQAYNGELTPLSGDERAARSERMYALSQPSPWDRIGDFKENHAAVIGVPLDHPALRHSRGLFADAWLDTEREIDRFLNGDFSRWTPKLASQITPPKSDSQSESLKLSALLERFIASKSPSEASDIRQVWSRLIEFIGDVEAASVSQPELDLWLIEVRKFPKTRKPSVMALDMRTIIKDHANELTLAPKTVWKWAGHANRVFQWGASMRMIPLNPMTAVMPKKPSLRERRKERRAYRSEEIGAMFSKPLFQGFSGDGDTGYRKTAGDQITKDAKYWLPIFALWHGCRLEEIGGAKVAEFKELDGIAYIDWTERKLKTPESSRTLPIHPKMREIGFFDYLHERRRARDTYLFPELPHDAADEEAGTRTFSKWWGFWSDANGFSDPNVDFHAFRHTFVRQCRGVIDEELRDLITGHVGIGGVGRKYGDGAAIKILFDAISKVNFPTFKV